MGVEISAKAYLRRNSSDMTCKDYIQFGQYDKLPFFTMEKSTPICGHVEGSRNFSKGFMYDDPHGHLLIWINLSGRQKTSHWPAIYTVNISLVLTAYQANCGTKKTSRSILKNVQPPKRRFNSCGVDPGPCISKDYFCDKRFNCVGETETERTHDELQCQYKAPASSSKSENGDVKKDTSIKNKNNDRSGGGAGQKDFDSVLVDPNALNTISWVLIGICTFLGILLILFLVHPMARIKIRRMPKKVQMPIRTHEMVFSAFGSTRTLSKSFGPAPPPPRSLFLFLIEVSFL